MKTFCFDDNPVAVCLAALFADNKSERNREEAYKELVEFRHSTESWFICFAIL